jgi:hypothetical protein
MSMDSTELAAFKAYYQLPDVKGIGDQRHTLYVGFRHQAEGGRRSWQWPWQTKSLSRWSDYFLLSAGCDDQQSWPRTRLKTYESRNIVSRWFLRWAGRYSVLKLVGSYIMGKVIEAGMETREVVSQGGSGALPYDEDAKEATTGLVESTGRSAPNLPVHRRKLSLDALDEDNTLMNNFVNDINLQHQAVQFRDLNAAAKRSLFTMMCEEVSEKLRQEVKALKPRTPWFKALLGLNQRGREEMARYEELESQCQSAQAEIDAKRVELLDTFANADDFKDKFPQSLTFIKWTDAKSMASQYKEDMKIFLAWERDVLSSREQRTTEPEQEGLKMQLKQADKYLKQLKLRYHPDKCALGNDDLKKKAGELLKTLFECHARFLENLKEPSHPSASQAGEGDSFVNGAARQEDAELIKLASKVAEHEVQLTDQDEKLAEQQAKYEQDKVEQQAKLAEQQAKYEQDKVEQQAKLAEQDAKLARFERLLEQTARSSQAAAKDTVQPAEAVSHTATTGGSSKTSAAGSPRAVNVAAFFPGAEEARRAAPSDVVEATAEETVSSPAPASAVGTP